jgi:HAD superfamily hydrolase (TIGR01509 family)
MEQRLQAGIFDMDGTLVNSEEVAPELESEFWPKLGVEYTEEFAREIVGMRKKDVYELAKIKNPDFSEKKADIEYEEFAQTVYKSKAGLISGVPELLDLLHKNDIRMAIASSSPLPWIEMVVERFGWKKYFEHLISVHTLDLPGKPNPAAFLEAMRLLGVTPEESIVFEDSIKGVEAGIASGARVVAIPGQGYHGDFSCADLVVDSLADSRIKNILGL